MFINKISSLLFFSILLASVNGFAQSKDTTMIVNGVCGMCKMTIETAAEDLDGVEKVSWDVETKVLKLRYDVSVTSLEDVNKAINKAGYDTEYSTADEKAYQNLHGCCKYRDPEVVKSHQ